MSSVSTTTCSQHSTGHSPEPTGPHSAGSSRSSSRPTGKGRRRRAAAEQRRLELQQWGELEDLLSEEQQGGGAIHGSPLEIISRSYEGPRPPGMRRQQRRASRRAQAAAEAAASRAEIEEYFAFHYSRQGQPEAGRGMPGRTASFPTSAEQEQLELALAVSLSLSDSGSVQTARAIQRTLQGDLSYENLVHLEDVSSTLSPDSLDSLGFRKVDCCSSYEEVCPICLAELVEGDAAVVLPCKHVFHKTCGSEWLLQYSRCCPVCKQEVPNNPDASSMEKAEDSCSSSDG